LRAVLGKTLLTARLQGPEQPLEGPHIGEAALEASWALTPASRRARGRV
jgi:hypothetical protein